MLETPEQYRSIVWRCILYIIGIYLGGLNVRLRSYSSYYKILQYTYPEDKTLTIETKETTEEFLPYGPNMLNVKVVK